MTMQRLENLSMNLKKMIQNKHYMKESVQEFCHKIGQDELLVQGAGGNISWKNENELWVKASGKWIADAKREEIFVTVDLKDLQEQINNKNFDPSPKLLSGSDLRPSIETMMHALMPQKVVLHLHAIEPLALLVKRDCEAELKERMTEYKFDWLIIDYVKPGKLLAAEIYSGLLRKPNADIIFLKNHGIVLAANSVEDLEKKLEIINNLFKSNNESKSSYDSIQIKNNSRNIKGYKLVKDESIQSLVWDEKLFSCLQNFWILYPDHVVFLGPKPFLYESLEELKDLELNEETPELIFVKNNGVYAKESFNHTKSLQLRCYYQVLIRQKNRSEIRSLTNLEIQDLLGWDAEKYRIDLAERKTV